MIVLINTTYSLYENIYAKHLCYKHLIKFIRKRVYDNHLWYKHLIKLFIQT
jgi:hypothetical protein